MLGGTAGRTTLNGEGLQHQDGHSLLNAIAFPTVRAYDPAYAYETAVIVFDGLKRLYEDGETAIYYITLRKRKLRDARDAGRLRGRHHPRHVQGVDASMPTGQHRVQLFGSGAILREALRAQKILAEKYQDLERRLERHQLHASCAATRRSASAGTCCNPTQPPRVSYVERAARRRRRAVHRGVATMCGCLAEQIGPWVPGGLFALGTDGMGRSESRGALRRHFEVDAECITLAALYQLKKQGKCDGACVASAVAELGIDPEKQSALYA